MENRATGKPEKGYNYIQLQENLERVLSKIGLANTVKLLENVVSDECSKGGDIERINVITEYIIAQVIRVFDLKPKKFYTCNVREYRDARMVAYHLLRKYTAGSYSKIGERFNQHKRNVIYFCNKCSETLSVARFHPVFAERYKTVEYQTITFISKLE
ncbi:hypothetical protein JMN32_08835 [Fulvivirga sp. 29W222]|uniref:Chromosomal replication initiator DnaA C-terminal domain-containing protein n=1 Tax=Fulvivirga marina TaxID=2494733 RepID=A0A937G0T3_9BACT|nr:helix-turn-helix domain-containing protein [Fulvivirga marina]MBL6446411.1 hypothetical protein [Fulvivirga marina]